MGCLPGLLAKSIGHVRKQVQWGARQADSAYQGMERLIAEMLKLLADWGFPFSSEHLCHFFKSYLDLIGVSSPFKDNLPTDSWTGAWKGIPSSPCRPQMQSSREEHLYPGQR